MTMRAVIYCRCSTEEESQKNALIKQEQEAKAAVAQNGWDLIDSYVESGSGTTTKGRNEYNRLYEDLFCDKFDVITVKSQDRLMRNTKDWYLFIERMNITGKKLYMYMEQKFYSPDDGLLTGIKAILAEDYSRELSKKINNAHRNRQKNNGAVILTSNVYGFRRNPDHTIELREEEAKVKRRMYELCAAGYGCRTIASVLKKDGIENRKGKNFSASDILRILKNPINKGTVVMNRRHYDFESRKIMAVPLQEQYIYKHKIPATVSEELWETANQKISERRSHSGRTLKTGIQGRYSGKHPLSGKTYCGLCGAPYYRRVRRRGAEKEKIYEWKCSRYLENGRKTSESSDGCNNVHVDENLLFKLLSQSEREYIFREKDGLLKQAMAMIRKLLQDGEGMRRICFLREQLEQISHKREILLDKLLQEILTDETYKRKNTELLQEEKSIKEKIELLKQQEKEGRTEEDRVNAIERYLKEQAVIEKAVVSEMLEKADRLMIYPDHGEIICGSEKQKIVWGNSFAYFRKKKEEREVILKLLDSNPSITAKELAEELGLSLSGVNYRLQVLKKEGKIIYWKEKKMWGVSCY
ncbi:MAG: recombinase family protein [Ruminococcus sp.]|jgi:site-specific DNA recombinase